MPAVAAIVSDAYVSVEMRKCFGRIQQFDTARPMQHMADCYHILKRVSRWINKSAARAPI